jgi:DNA-binding transcriptional LysR family regulator
MSNDLPFHALRIFEAAARHRSFALAVEELHVMPP